MKDQELTASREEEESAVMISNGYTSLSIEHWPDRKRPTLCHHQGARIQILAFFKSEEAAKVYEKFILGLIGKTLSAEGTESEANRLNPQSSTPTNGEGAE